MLVNEQARLLGSARAVSTSSREPDRGLGLPAAEGAHVDLAAVYPAAGRRHARGGGWPARGGAGRSAGRLLLAAQSAGARVAGLAPARVAYLQLAGGALPVSVSDMVQALKERGLLEVAVAVAPCHDADAQAVTAASALAWAARGLRGSGVRDRARHSARGRRWGTAAWPLRRLSTRRPPSTDDPYSPRAVRRRRARAPPGPLAPHAYGAPTLPRENNPGLAGRVVADVSVEEVDVGWRRPAPACRSRT